MTGHRGGMRDTAARPRAGSRDVYPDVPPATVHEKHHIMQHKVVIIQGPTCAGKTDVALKLASCRPVEIINADSMQFYRYMDIGTSKPLPAQMHQVPHHLFSVAPPDRQITAAEFMKRARTIIDEVAARGAVPFVVGGTGLYLKALTHGVFEAPQPDEQLRKSLNAVPPDKLRFALQRVDPEAAQRIAPYDTVRMVRALEIYYATGRPISWHHRRHGFRDTPFQCCTLCITRDRETLYKRIEQRVDRMIENGFIDEVRALLEMGFSPELPAMRSIGYKEITAYLQRRLSLDEALAAIKTSTKRYAKRQLTWFRKDSACRWITLPEDAGTAEGVVEMFLKT